MLQPTIFNGVLDLAKPIKSTAQELWNVGDVYFDGWSWKVVAAKAESEYSTMALQDCTDYVRAVGRVTTQDGTLWSVAAYELAHSKNDDEWFSLR